MQLVKIMEKKKKKRGKGEAGMITAGDISKKQGRRTGMMEVTFTESEGVGAAVAINEQLAIST